MSRFTSLLLLFFQASALVCTQTSAFGLSKAAPTTRGSTLPISNHDRIRPASRQEHLRQQRLASSTIEAPPGASHLRESDDTNTDNDSQAHLVFPGGGIFFYWQAGAVTHLRQAGYDLSQVSMSGASAGALSATLTTAGVCFEEATTLALDLAEEAGVWDRGSLQGIWGPLIERWLDELLPENAHEVATDKLSLLVTPVPSFGKTRVSQFEDRSDLIRCNMASVHLPWFLNSQLTTDFRDSKHIDGSFLAKPTDYVPSDSKQRSVVRLDWTEDPGMATGAGDFVKLVSKEGIWGMLNQGRTYAAEVMERRGDFDGLPRL